MAIAATASEDEHKQMKEGKDNRDCSNNYKFTEDELEAANVLLQLRSSILTKNNKQLVYSNSSYYYYKFEFDWGTKKRRSAVANPPNYTNFVAVIKQQQQAPSPNTPLSFSPSQTDSTPHKYTDPLHLRKKELKEAVEGKFQTQQQLKESIRKVKEYLKTIMAENSALKAKKRKVLNGEQCESKRMKATMTTDEGSSSSSLQVVQPPPLINLDYHHIQDDVNDLKQGPPLIHPRHQHHHGGAVAVWRSVPVYAGTSLQLHYQQPLIHHQAYPMLQYHHHHRHRSQQLKQHVVQIDLNVLPSAEDEHMIKRVEAREARKNRMCVNKEKKTRVIPTP